MIMKRTAKKEDKENLNDIEKKKVEKRGQQKKKRKVR